MMCMDGGSPGTRSRMMSSTAGMALAGAEVHLTSAFTLVTGALSIELVGLESIFMWMIRRQDSCWQRRWPFLARV